MKLGSSEVFDTGVSPMEEALEFVNYALRYNSQTPTGSPMVEFWTPSNLVEKAAFSSKELDFSGLQGDLVFGCNPDGTDCYKGFISNY